MSKDVDTNESTHVFSNGIKVGCFTRSQAVDTPNAETYYIRKNHIVGNQTDEFIDLPEALLNEALNKTNARKAAAGETWAKPYPSPQIVRSEFRPKETPLLIIYPLNPEASNTFGGKERLFYKATDEPFIGFALVFPHSDVNKAISYVSNQVADFAVTEDLFDESNDNTYDEQ